MKQSAQQRAKLRVCASCEWIYQLGNPSNPKWEHTHPEEEFNGCPKCGFASYGARFVYGSQVYRHAQTQEPWIKKKLQRVELDLLHEIEQTNPLKRTRKTSLLTLGDP